jgi:hypothetical protein
MQTQCNPMQYEFSGIGRRSVIARFDGGTVSSDAGALLLKKADEAVDLLRRLGTCFQDDRRADAVEFPVHTLVAPRVIGIALGYEDLNDHEQLRHDPLLGAVIGKLESGRARCAALAGKSTLNRLELFQAQGSSRYHKIRPQGEQIEGLFVDLFLESYRTAPRRIVLDLDATDDPLHGAQEGRFFHGYYDSYCYLPLYIFCGRHLLCAKLRTADQDGAAGALEEVERIVEAIRVRWPQTQIVLRADSGFARDALMSWCEAHNVDYVLGLARNARLTRAIGGAMQQAHAQHQTTGRSARVFQELTYRTKKSWSATRRVVAKAEVLPGKTNPRFVVTSLCPKDWDARTLYEDLYCARGEMENRIKECQLDLFADRTSTATFRANQLRLWLSSFAYVLIDALRRLALQHTDLANATVGTIRLKLLKIGAVISLSVRRVKVAMSSAFPHQPIFDHAFHVLSAAAR